MDRILFFYPDKKLSVPKLTAMYDGDVMLIKIGINVDKTHWFGHFCGKRSGDEEQDHQKVWLYGTSDEHRRVDLCIIADKIEALSRDVEMLLHAEGAGEICRGDGTGSSHAGEICGRDGKGSSRAGEICRGDGKGSSRAGEICGRDGKGSSRAGEICRGDGKGSSRADRKGETCGEKGKGLRTMCVYLREVRQVLLANRQDMSARERQEEYPIATLWREKWCYPEYDQYPSIDWTQRMMPQAVPAGFVILGYAEGMFEALYACSDRMKSIQWLVDKPQAEAVEQAHGLSNERKIKRREVLNTKEGCNPAFCIQNAMEDFYEDTGVTATFYDMGEKEIIMAGRQLSASGPITVLDFTRNAYIPVRHLPRGSVWIDYYSVEGKKDYLRRFSEGVIYLSVKERWHKRQKHLNLPYFLDITGENSYNASVKNT